MVRLAFEPGGTTQRASVATSISCRRGAGTVFFHLDRVRTAVAARRSRTPARFDAARRIDIDPR